MNRSIQVEGAFGVIKWDHEFNRFLRRGKKHVRSEFMLLSFAYNIRKLHAKIQADRCDQSLHPLRIVQFFSINLLGLLKCVKISSPCKKYLLPDFELMQKRRCHETFTVSRHLLFSVRSLLAVLRQDMFGYQQAKRGYGQPYNMID